MGHRLKHVPGLPRTQQCPPHRTHHAFSSGCQMAPSHCPMSGMKWGGGEVGGALQGLLRMVSTKSHLLNKCEHLPWARPYRRSEAFSGGLHNEHSCWGPRILLRETEATNEAAERDGVPDSDVWLCRLQAVINVLHWASQCIKHSINVTL